MSGATSKRHPADLRERAVRMVGEIRADHESEWAAMTQVAQLLGIGTPETVRTWCRHAEVDAGRRPGTTSDESVELKRMKRENAELRLRPMPITIHVLLWAWDVERAAVTHRSMVDSSA